MTSSLLRSFFVSGQRRKPWYFLQRLFGHFQLAWESFCRISALGKWPVRQVLYKQLYFTGTESLLTIGFVGFLVGLIVITELNNLVGSNQSLTNQVLIWVVVRELGPLIAAIVMVGRSSSAFASELAMMQINGEIKNLRCMGISPMSYLVMPRVLAMMLASIALGFYCQIVAIGTGWVVTSMRLDVLMRDEITSFFEIISYGEIVATLFKSAVFGIVVAVVSCHHGLRRKTAMTEVTRAVSQAVIRSLLAVFVADGLITVFVY
jgi:phospholipid/cholesterol/gamma-HCH transport system permease protein